MEQPASNKRCLEIDPDYKISETALKRAKLKEDKEKQCTVEKIREVISQEFEGELERRQKQLELIQQNIIKAQKTLHLLRYVIITSYYNKQELLINSSDDAGSADIIDKQGRIHPAIKKLLGNNFTNVDLSYSCSRRKRAKQIKYLNNTITQESQENTLKQILEFKIPVKEEEENIVKNEDPPVLTEAGEESNYNFVRNRKKTRHRVVIGNISKFLPSEGPEDTFTHKWMVYVRGPKEEPDVSHFIQKVVFYLHPSYKPNDVVELRESPFHLSRRGWGEFPLRVQIYFQCKRNKPIDIVHNLKLDKTYTGRQTLGNETVVDLFLYEDGTENDGSKKDTIVKEFKEEVKLERPSWLDIEIKKEIDIEETQLIDPNSYSEHNYCFNDGDDDNNGEQDLHSSIDSILNEHDYCGNLENPKAKKTELVNLQSQNQKESEKQECQLNENNVIEEAVVDDFTVNLQAGPDQNQSQKVLLRRLMKNNVFKKMVTSDGRVFLIKTNKSPRSLLKKVFNSNAAESKDDSDTFLIDIPHDRFKCVLEALPYLFKRLPIITELANDPIYKSFYPYSAESLEEYRKWNVGKRMSAEWRRAKMILNMLKEAKVYENEKWNTRDIIMYARSHGYTPLTNFKHFRKTDGFSLIDHKPPSDSLAKERQINIPEPEVYVDVDDSGLENEIKPPPREPKLSMIYPSTKSVCAYVRSAALDKGVLLKNEELVPGVIFNGAEHTILQAVVCLAESLIRKSMASKVIRGCYSENSVINVGDVDRALRSRPEFKKYLL